jgi:hypothetical protein
VVVVGRTTLVAKRRSRFQQLDRATIRCVTAEPQGRTNTDRTIIPKLHAWLSRQLYEGMRRDARGGTLLSKQN